MQTSQNADPTATATPTAIPAGKGGAPRSAAGRDAFLARAAARPFDKGDEAPPAKEPPPAADPDGDDDAADLADATGTPEKPAAKEPPPADEVKLSPEAAKQLAASQKREREWGAKVAADRKAIADERAAWERAQAEAKASHEKEWAPREAAFKEFEATKGKVRHSPLAVLRSLGYVLDDAGAQHLARAAWAETEAGKSDPKNRAFVEQAARERERDTGLDTRLTAAEERAKAAEERAAEAMKKLEEREQSARQEAQANAYLDGVQKAVTAETPHTHRWAQKSPAAAREAFGHVAYDLYKRDGVEPTAAEVVAEVEQRMRADLEARGFDPDAVIAPAPAKKPPAPAPGRTLAPGGAGPTTPKPKLTKEQMRERFIRKEP